MVVSSFRVGYLGLRWMLSIPPDISTLPQPRVKAYASAMLCCCSEHALLFD
jgi:hypothetical protein